jgi:alcohol dehydrogenase (cytochrome c)
MLYVSVANTSPDVDGTARIGINLFTDSVVALDVATGQLKWYYQQVHHDLWDYDSASHPALFDVQIGGQTVKAVAQAQKNGYLYILNRETGRPLHGDIETPVPTATNVPGEEPWPTQPVPLKVNGQPMEPFVPLFPSKPTPENATAVPWMTAPSIDMAKPFFHSPGVLGGANFAPLSYSAKTGLVYVVGIDWPCTFWVTPVGATLLPGQSSFGGGLELIGPPTGTLTAYDPATGELVWQTATPGYNQAGSAVTAGNLVFVGDHLGYFYAFDATTGTQMWKFNAGSYVKSSPMIYEINGKQFISVNAGDDILTFGLPGN